MFVTSIVLVYIETYNSHYTKLDFFCEFFRPPVLYFRETVTFILFYSLLIKEIALEKEVTNIHQPLIEACRRGDEAAPMKLYRLYYKAVYSISYRILANSFEAEDVMQETFLSAFEHIEQYKGEVSFGAWIKKIAINKSIDAVRSRPGFIDFDAEIPDLMADDDVQYSEYVNYRLEEIRLAIQKLPDQYRVILSLFLIEGYDHEEISQILGISYSLSRTRYSRAKKKLLRILSEQSVLKMFVPN